jgi:hypothetical protein
MTANATVMASRSGARSAVKIDGAGWVNRMNLATVTRDALDHPGLDDVTVDKVTDMVTSPQYLTRTMAVAMEVNVEPPARVLRCELCNTAFEAADTYRPADARHRAVARGY